MALTMTRTRTQTTLTKLVTQLARINGELEALREGPADDPGLAIRERHREALVLTLHQFDSTLDFAVVGALKEKRTR